MRGDARLVEQDRLFGVDPRRHQRRRHLARVRGQLGRIVVDGDRVEVGKEIELLARHVVRSEEHTSELQSLMRISYAVFCLKTKKRPRTPQSRTCHNMRTLTLT